MDNNLVNLKKRMNKIDKTMDNHLVNLEKIEEFIVFMNENNYEDNIIYDAMLCYLGHINLDISNLEYINNDDTKYINNYFDYVDKINQFIFCIYSNILLINDLIKYKNSIMKNGGVKRPREKEEVEVEVEEEQEQQSKKNKHTKRNICPSSNTKLCYMNSLIACQGNDDIRNHSIMIDSSLPNYNEFIRFLLITEPSYSADNYWKDYYINSKVESIKGVLNYTINTDDKLKYPFDYFNCFVLNSNYQQDRIDDSIIIFLNYLNNYMRYTLANIVKPKIDSYIAQQQPQIPRIPKLPDNPNYMNNISVFCAIFYSEKSNNLLKQQHETNEKPCYEIYRNIINMFVNNNFNFTTIKELTSIKFTQLITNVYNAYNINIVLIYFHNQNFYIHKNDLAAIRNNASLNISIFRVIIHSCADSNDNYQQFEDITINGDTIIYKSSEYKVDYVIINHEKCFIGFTKNSKKYIYNYYSNVYSYIGKGNEMDVPFPPIEYSWNTNIETASDTVYHLKDITCQEQSNKYVKYLYQDNNNMVFTDKNYMYIFIKQY